MYPQIHSAAPRAPSGGSISRPSAVPEMVTAPSGSNLFVGLDETDGSGLDCAPMLVKSEQTDLRPDAGQKRADRWEDRRIGCLPIPIPTIGTFTIRACTRAQVIPRMSRCQGYIVWLRSSNAGFSAPTREPYSPARSITTWTSSHSGSTAARRARGDCYSAGCWSRLCPMRFRVVRMREHRAIRGRCELPRDDGVVGELLVTQRKDVLLGRTAQVAQLVRAEDARRDDLLPPLVDPVRLGAAAGGLISDPCDGRIFVRPTVSE